MSGTIAYALPHCTMYGVKPFLVRLFSYFLNHLLYRFYYQQTLISKIRLHFEAFTVVFPLWYVFSLISSSLDWKLCLLVDYRISRFFAHPILAFVDFVWQIRVRCFHVLGVLEHHIRMALLQQIWGELQLLLDFQFFYTMLVIGNSHSFFFQMIVSWINSPGHSNVA